MQPRLLKKLVVVCLMLLGLNACMTNINGDFCLLYEPIYADYENDTSETIKQIDRNNVVFEVLCES